MSATAAVISTVTARWTLRLLDVRGGLRPLCAESELPAEADLDGDGCVTLVDYTKLVDVLQDGQREGLCEAQAVAHADADPKPGAAAD